MLILIDLGIQAIIHTIYTNLNLFYNSFYPSTIIEWNNLAQEIIDASSVASFKYQLDRETRNHAQFVQENAYSPCKITYAM